MRPSEDHSLELQFPLGLKLHSLLVDGSSNVEVSALEGMDMMVAWNSTMSHPGILANVMGYR
jgi:hypothetical protein